MGPAMSVIALIPARGGSKGLPGKNLLPVGGRALVERAVEACRLSDSIDRVVVTTDDDAIATCAREVGAEVVRRPAALSGDHATSESALIHALDVADPLSTAEIVVFVQCTSPFIDPDDLDSAVARVTQGEDVVFSAAESHAFVWTDSFDGLVGVNHDSATRSRRQDRPREVVETGAFYVMRRSGFDTTGHRFFGRVGALEVHPLHRFEIDASCDADLCDAVARLADPLGPPSLVRRPVDALVTDFDGVHTDDRVSVSQTGTETVTVHRGDGMGVARLRAAGYRVLILSTERNPVVAERARKLGVECLSGIDDKRSALQRWADRIGIDVDRIAYLGNDINDRECLETVGTPIVVANAHPDLLEIRGVVRTRRRGGDGAVREVADALLSNRGAAELAPAQRCHQDAVLASSSLTIPHTSGVVA